MNISRNILNEAIDLSLEWEYDSREKLSIRIKGLYPELSKVDALNIEKLCRDVKRYTTEKAKVATSVKQLMVLVEERFNFISKSNLETLSRQAWFWNQ